MIRGDFHKAQNQPTILGASLSQEGEWKKAEEEAKKKAKEDARRNAEEERWRAEEEEKRKAEEERWRTEEGRRTAELASQAIPQKRKSGGMESEDEEDSEEEDEAEGAGKEKGKGAQGLLKPSLGMEWDPGPLPAPTASAGRCPALTPRGSWRPCKPGSQCKQVKKSAPIVVDDDEPTTPTKKSKGKGKAVGSGQWSTEKVRGVGAAAGVAESGGEGSGQVHLGQEEKEWSADLEPEQLMDRELLQHVLVEGQMTRLGMSHLLHHMEEEGELRAQWALADSKVMRQAVRKEVGKWAEEELRPMIRAEIRSILVEFF
ncbi:hypothetical protein ACG7TL_001758 [Trametes sanguinea]